MGLVVVLPQLSSAQLFFSFFVTENAVIDVTVWEMVTNIAPLHTFQIIIKLSKYMEPILKYSKNNMWFFWMAPKVAEWLTLII
jgi:protein gp37